MPTFRGQPVFRPRGQYKDHPVEDWEGMARRAVKTGGRIVKSDTGELHILSPSDAHWGTYKQTQGLFEGGTLQKLGKKENLQDITEQFQ